MIDAHPDHIISEVLARELPGFWAYFKARNPEFAMFGRPDGPPIGAMHLPVAEVLGPTITAYVAEHGCGHTSDCAVHSCDCGASA